MMSDAPSHYLKQCCQIITEVVKYSNGDNIIENAQYINIFHEFHNYLAKITAASLNGQWINAVDNQC